MSHDPDSGSQLQWSGERFMPQMRGNIRLEHLHRYFLAREMAAHKRVLDIACGEGYGSNLLAEVADHVIGVDIAPEAVAHASAHYTRTNLEFLVGSCAAVPLVDGAVDLVVCFETIEHLADHEAMMREVKRVLAPGGSLVISSPDKREYSDLPSYRNPFHVRELYRDEFERLLRSYFRDVVIVGQRIWAGSVTWMLEQPSGSQIGFSTDDSGALSKGPLAPLYLIAVASDEKASTVPLSVLDGGGFVWPEDYLQALHAAEQERQTGLAGLEAANRQHETDTASLRTVLDSQRTRLLALSGKLTASEAHVAQMHREIEHRRAQVGELEGARAELARVRDLMVAHAATESQADLLRNELQQLRRRVAEFEHANAQLQQTVEHLAAPLEDTQRQLRTAASRLDEFDHLRQAWMGIEHSLRMTLGHSDSRRYQLEGQIAAMQRSISWRLTAPLRAMRSLFRSAKGAVRRSVGGGIRAVYGGLPLSIESRLKVKSAIFGAAPALFRQTSAYQAWDVHRRTQLRLDAEPPRRASVEPAPLVGAPTVYVQVPDAEIAPVPLATAPCASPRIKAVAFYLPQFHPIPENDQWWGKGFTEWANVARGRPQFDGHYQPHLPGELGFYDLRLVEVQQRQIELARLYGLHGFCYHHYWFGGRRLLRRPLDQVLAHANLDLPFCLCWANENWTRRWDGHDEDILVAQQHSPEDDLAFIRDIEPALRDPRYIRVDGRPLLVVYRPAQLPNAPATAERWREHCSRVGIGDLFLVSTQAFDLRNPVDLGFDAAMEFAPNNLGSPPINGKVPTLAARFRGVVYDYDYLVERSRQYESPPGYDLFRCVAPMWDNEARRPEHGKVFVNSTPARYAEWLENACRHTETRLGPDRQLVFINAWNEWAEGAHLEPDQRYGYAYLQATADVLGRVPVARTGDTQVGPANLAVASHG